MIIRHVAVLVKWTNIRADDNKIHPKSSSNKYRKGVVIVIVAYTLGSTACQDRA
jgi:hypothetical protein